MVEECLCWCLKSVFMMVSSVVMVVSSVFMLDSCSFFVRRRPVALCENNTFFQASKIFINGLFGLFGEAAAW